MNESVGDVLNEMRETAKRVNWFYSCSVFGWVDRIETAYKLHLTDGKSLEQYAENEKRLENENALLRAALRPVLSCPCTENTTADEAAHNCMTAVIDALHIWRAGCGA